MGEETDVCLGCRKPIRPGSSFVFVGYETKICEVCHAHTQQIGKIPTLVEVVEDSAPGLVVTSGVTDPNPEPEPAPEEPAPEPLPFMPLVPPKEPER